MCCNGATLSEKLFPEGTKAGWWTKALQLDVEAKGIVVREKTKPLRCARCDVESEQTMSCTYESEVLGKQ